MLISGLTAQPIVNGGLEQWTGNRPDGWTTIDSGIGVSIGAVATEGARSAAISVNTTSQASTDFRQSIAVVAGTTYDVRVRVFHTEGGVRARLYVDGYRNYSNENLVDQWQQISFRYEASSTKNIDVGLRFYDVSGFDGSEVVFVDHFQPASAAVPGDCQASVLDIVTDRYGSETSWAITDSSGATVDEGSGYASNQSFSETLCLSDGTYTLTFNDSFGDGMCCQFGNGGYTLTVGTTVV
ncbi:MAG: carbohydrate binding domain-containing protein, partial [Myxococcota bacterium]